MSVSPRKFWMHLTNKKEGVKKLKVNNVDVIDPRSLAIAFNDYFSSVFVRTVDSPPECLVSCINIPDLVVTEEGIFSALLHLDAKKSAGPDDIPNAFLVRYAEWCSRFLFVIFRDSILRGEVPEDWKKAKVVPVPKTGDKFDIKNYRPISLLCTASKVMEHFLFKHISSFLEQNNFFSPNQHGFRRGFSTATQLIHTTNDLFKSLDEGGQIAAVFIDFEKAFDRVSHSHLLFKIKKLLANPKILRWLDSYLSGRFQYVHIANNTSNLAPVYSGVPQGSVLGPLLFLIYLNDLSSSSSVRCRLFADDCVAYLPVRTRDDQTALSTYLSAITDWCNSWKMSLNVKKCAQMTITRKRDPLEFSYKLNNTALQTVHQFKYLGVTITSNLSWNTHIRIISSIAIQRLWLLRHRLKHCTSKTKQLAYTSLVRPILEYADVVWDPHTKADIHCLERIQNKSLRFIYNAYGRRVSVTELRIRSGLPTLQARRKIHRLKFLFNIVNNNLGIAFDTYMQFNKSRQTRNKHAKTIEMPRTKTNAHRFSFFPRTISDWNALPQAVTEIVTPESFVSSISSYF